MQRNVFEFLGHRVELWTHPEPDHLATTIRTSKTWYEADVLMKCRELYVPGTAIVDVGANIGNHTVFFAAILGATVHAFEPYQPNYNLLLLNLAANGLEERVKAHSLAVGEHDGTGIARVMQPNNLGKVQINPGEGEVVVRSLDSLEIPGPIGLLKIDVEGGEVPVLRGARSLIRTWLPDVLVEAGQRQEFDAAARLLLDYGYVPKGRYAWTPTYLFSASDQERRLRAILGFSAIESD